jgi:hypothetical protein
LYTREYWNDRLVEFPNRFAKSNEDENVVTLTPDPGTITELGTAISAIKLNRIDQGVFDAQLLAYMGGF